MHEIIYGTYHSFKVTQSGSSLPCNNVMKFNLFYKALLQCDLLYPTIEWNHIQYMIKGMHRGLLILQVLGGGQKICLNLSVFPNLQTQFQIPFNENLSVRESFKFKHSIRTGKVFARTMHLFYVIYTRQPNKTVLTISE